MEDYLRVNENIRSFGFKQMTVIFADYIKILRLANEEKNGTTKDFIELMQNLTFTRFLRCINKLRK